LEIKFGFSLITLFNHVLIQWFNVGLTFAFKTLARQQPGSSSLVKAATATATAATTRRNPKEEYLIIQTGKSLGLKEISSAEFWF